MRGGQVKAVILAAGKGTRLGKLTQTRPKPMVEIGDRPCLERIVMALSSVGVRDLVVVTGYLAEMVEQYFDDGTAWGANMTYLRQEVQDGTGSALHLARDAIGNSPFVMTYGDILVSSENYAGMIAAYRKGDASAVIGLNWVEDPYRGAAVYLDDQDEVLRIQEKPPKGTASTHWNNAGIYVFDPVIFDYTARLTLSPRGEYELPDAIQSMLGAGLPIRGFRLDGYWRDIGTPDDVQAASEVFGKAPVKDVSE